MTDITSLWVGLVDLELDDGPDDQGSIGAFVWTVGQAESAAEFERRVTASLAKQGASILELKHLERLSERSARERLSRELRRLVHHARRTSDPAFGQWQCYPDEG